MRFSLPSIKCSPAPPSFRLLPSGGNDQIVVQISDNEQISAVVVSWEDPTNTWLTAAKNAIVGWAFNFRVRVLLKSAVNRIYYLQKRAVQAVTNSDYRAHTAPLFSKLKILDIFQINTLDIAKFMFRYHNNLLPPLFLHLFMTNSQVHTYDTRTAGNYRMHSCRTNIKKITILYQGPRIWNCLPASITNLSSFPTFKNKVLEF